MTAPRQKCPNCARWLVPLSGGRVRSHLTTEGVRCAPPPPPVVPMAEFPVFIGSCRHGMTDIVCEGARYARKECVS